MRYLLLIILFITLNFPCPAQSVTSLVMEKRIEQEVKSDKKTRKIIVLGSVKDFVDKQSLPGAHIFYGDGQKLSAVSDLEGNFKFVTTDTVRPTLSVTYTGHQPFVRNYTISSTKDTIYTGTLFLKPQLLDEITVTATPPLTVQRGDTTQFNADAVKLAADANLENLIKKLPGFEIVDGKIMAQGREIEKLYVDGTTYFLNDPQGALKNLPANLISKIKLFDDRSEEAKFSGYEDGSKFRALNVETKNPNKPKYFGDVNLGYGISDNVKNTFKDNNYTIGGNGSFFDNKRRLTLDGNFHSTDQAGELSGAILPGNSGDNKNHNIGANFSYNKKQKISVTGMFRANGSESYSGSMMTQDYFKTDRYDSRIYDSENHSWRHFNNYNANAIVQYYINKKDRLNLNSSFTKSDNNSTSLQYARNIEDNDTINRSLSRSINNSTGNNFRVDATWMHAFEKKGRTFTLKSGISKNKTQSDQRRVSRERNLNNENIYIDTLRNQLTYNDQNSNEWNVSVSYSEPVSEKARISFNYSHNAHKSIIDKKSISFLDSLFQQEIGIDTALTNQLKNVRITDRLGVNFNISNKKISFNGGTSLNFSRMDNSYTFISSISDSVVRSSYVDISPRADIRFNMENNKSLSVQYHGNTTSPSASQLQDVLNVSNSLQVSTGNPNLHKSYRQSVSMYYDRSNPEKSRYMSVNVSGGQTFNKIANDVQFIERDTIINGYAIQRGARFTLPVNLNGDWSMNSSVNFSFPWEKLKLRFNTNMAYGFTHTPTIYDSQRTLSDAHNVSFMLGISTNISEDFDFYVSSRSSYTNTTNTSTGVSEYFSQSVSSYLQWTFWKGFFLGGNFDYQYYLNKKGDAINQSNKMLNTYIGKKIGKQRIAEVRFSMNDMFREQDQINYQLTDLYASTSRNTTLANYYVLSFSYRFNSMRKANKRSSSTGNNMEIYE
ncbi:MAG: outer membrane beta-barrel protein [Marinifilaceae bacterium]